MTKTTRFTKSIATLFICLLIIAATATGTFAAAINTKAAVLMDASSGEVIFEQNANTPLAPASMGKLMTVYILLDQVKQGNLTLDTPVSISSKTSVLSKDSTYSNVPLQTNQQYTMDQLLASIVTVSACASSKAVAEHISGNEWAFAQLMNDYAQQMGLTAKFVDSSGISPQNRITAKSMATLSQRLITDFPEILTYTKRPSINFANKTYYSTNKMLDGMPQAYAGMDGLKTGFISEAKYCFTGTAQRGDVRLVSVVMGAPSISERTKATKQLFDYGFTGKGLEMNSKPVKANPSTAQVVLNGQAIPCKVYDIEGSNYLNLRDIAAALTGTTKGFSVEWNQEQNSILLNTQAAYKPIGGELMAGTVQVANSTAIKSKIQLDGSPVKLKGYSISDTSFFSLRDIAKAINIGITWDSTSRTIQLDPNTDYVM